MGAEARSEAAPGAGGDGARAPFALRADRLFDGVQVRARAAVVVDGATIAGVGEVPSGMDVIDLGDATLLPGLVDTHQHLVFDGQGSLEEQVVGHSDDELRERARQHARQALRAGITTIRDLGDRGFVTLDLRGEDDLPTILASGPPITIDEGHCWFLGGCCRDDEGFLAAVAERQERGCDVVKVMVTGGVLTPTHPLWASQLSFDQLALIVDAAHAAGLPVAAHCHGVGGMADALSAGVDTIEHCTFMHDGGHSEPVPDLVERIAASGTAVSATLGVLPGHRPPPVVEANMTRMLEGLRLIREQGGTIVVGTDAGVGLAKPHDVLPLAHEQLAVVGIAGVELLTTLTATAADVCGVGARKGRLAPGYDADILAVAGDPADEPAALLDVRGVWRRGQAVER